MASAYLEITLRIDEADRAKAAGIYTQFKAPFLETIPGALTKELLVHPEEVKVLHGFDSTQNAQAYLLSDLFAKDVVGLQPYLKGTPDIKVYQVGLTRIPRPCNSGTIKIKVSLFVGIYQPIINELNG